MKTITKYFTALLFVLTLALSAQQKDYTNEPGYVEFGDLTVFETGEAVTEVYLSGNLLKMVAKITEKEDPQVSELINGLQLIKVNSFEVSDANEDDLREKMKSIDAKLDGKDWQRIVRRISNKELVYVYVRTGSAEKFTGLVVLALNKPGEAAFVNIVGEIDLETIGKLTDKFNIPALHNVNGHDEKEMK